MKKTLLFLAITFVLSSSGFSQNTTPSTTQNETHQNFNEIKLNGLFLILGAFEATYERTLNEESGIGISLLLPFDDEVIEDINYYISTYYRFYFGNKYAAGFFLEGFGMLNSLKEYSYSFDNNSNLISTDKNVTDFALGIGLGGKWVTKRGLIGEINFGVGRNLFNSSDIEDNDFVGKLGITLGYRF